MEGQTLILYVNRLQHGTILVGSWSLTAANALVNRLRALPSCEHAEVMHDTEVMFLGLSLRQALNALV